MDQLEVFRETVQLAEKHAMPAMPGSEVGLDHLRAMLATIEDQSFTEDKLGRWLGWAQCAVVAAGIGVSLNDMKELNSRHPIEWKASDSSYWRRQYKAAEKAKMVAIGFADQAQERLRKASEAAASELAELRSALGWVRKLHQPSAAATCCECGRDWPCATIRAVGDSV
jgi:hypothetical protein